MLRQTGVGRVLREMARPFALPPWRTVVVPALLCGLGLGAHLLAPAMGWGIVGSLGGGLVAALGALLLMGALHGRRLACPVCGEAMPFGPRDGYEHRLVTCRTCDAHLHVGTEGLSVMPERVVASATGLEPPREMARR